nr:trihelix transcription factor ASR3-like isoform X2 [Nicotiana tomentosiformis]
MDNILVGDQGGSSMLRDYRKGNWTVQETMVLIEAKKMDDERRNRRQGDINERGKPTELRWKWVEDYCWRNSCLRSQNQCNDKWDNLMRDFKKVREYERREAKKAAEVGEEITSYWKIEKNERKEKSLPTNMLPEIYEALVEIVDRKGQKMLPASLLPTLQQQSTQPQITALPLPPPPLPPPTTAVVAQTAAPQLSDVAYTGQYPFPTVDPDTSDLHSDSPAKKRRMSGEGTSSGTAKGNINNSSQEVGSAISKSAVIIAEAIQSCEEREEKRHRELLSLHERRLKIEESKAEINREGINGLVDSINKLANSILALAGNKNQSAP